MYQKSSRSVQAESPDSLVSTREAIVKHFTEFPTHGYNCSCLDALIRDVRRGVDPIAFNYEAQNKQTDLERKMRYAMLHVVHAAGRG